MRTLGSYFSDRENNFNLIRLLAALAVVYGHAWAAAKPDGTADIWTRLVGWGFSGGVAVDMFFVISGFLVTASMLRGDWRRYIAGRVLRIYPGLILCTLLMVFVLGPAVTKSAAYWTSAETWRFLLVNATAYGVQFTLPGVFQEIRDTAVNGVLWSIVIEVRLYVVVFFLYLAGILQRRSLFNAIALLVLTIGYLAPAVIPFGNSSTDRHVAALFVLGMLCWINRDRLILNEFILLGILCAAGMVQGTDKFVIGYSILITYSVFMLAFLPGLDWFRRIGDYSYGIYLYGWPVQQLVMMTDPGMPPWKNALIACPIALAAGALSWHFFESPTLALKDKFKGRPALAQAGRKTKAVASA